MMAPSPKVNRLDVASKKYDPLQASAAQRAVEI